MTRQDQIAELEKEYLGTTMSTVIGGVEYFGECWQVLYFTTERKFKAKCKFYNEYRFFYKEIA